MTEARTLLIFEQLEPRKSFLDAVQVEVDVRDAMAKAERRLRDRASHWHLTGWVDVGDIEYTHPAKGLIAAKLRMERP